MAKSRRLAGEEAAGRAGAASVADRGHWEMGLLLQCFIPLSVICLGVLVYFCNNTTMRNG